MTVPTAISLTRCGQFSKSVNAWLRQLTSGCPSLGNCAERTEGGGAYDERRTRKMIRARRSIMVIAAKLFPGAHGAVDRLRAEVAARR
jgi:hypothetical protein